MLDNNIQTYIQKQIKTFSVTDAALAELKDKYLLLKINGIEDKEGYKAVVEARRDVKKRRVDVEKKRKELKEDSIIYGRAIDGKAKIITQHLEEVENHLLRQETAFEVEKERIKQEKIESEKQAFQGRTVKLTGIGFHFDSINFKANRDEFSFVISAEDVRALDDSAFQALLEREEGMFLVEREREIKKQLLDEEYRIQQQALKAQEEAKKAEEIRLQQEELERKSAAIEADNERIKKERAEKQAEIDKLTKEIEDARLEKFKFRVGLLENLGIAFDARINGFSAPFFNGDNLSSFQLERLSDSEFTQTLRNYEAARNIHDETQRTLEIVDKVSEQFIELEKDLIDEIVEKVNNHQIATEEESLERLVFKAQHQIKDICASLLIEYGFKADELVFNLTNTKWNIEHNGYRLFSCNIGEYLNTLKGK